MGGQRLAHMGEPEAEGRRRIARRVLLSVRPTLRGGGLCGGPWVYRASATSFFLLLQVPCNMFSYVFCIACLSWVRGWVGGWVSDPPLWGGGAFVGLWVCQNSGWAGP